MFNKFFLISLKRCEKNDNDLNDVNHINFSIKKYYDDYGCWKIIKQIVHMHPHKSKYIYKVCIKNKSAFIIYDCKSTQSIKCFFEF